MKRRIALITTLALLALAGTAQAQECPYEPPTVTTTSPGPHRARVSIPNLGNAQEEMSTTPPLTPTFVLTYGPSVKVIGKRWVEQGGGTGHWEPITEPVPPGIEEFGVAPGYYVQTDLSEALGLMKWCSPSIQRPGFEVEG